MITRDEFPYLQELLINDAYAVKNRRVTVFEPGQEFKHLVLTGRNGSGKTTVLRGLFNILDFDTTRFDKAKEAVISAKSALEHGTLNDIMRRQHQETINKLSKVSPHYESKKGKPRDVFNNNRDDIFLTYFEALRKTQVRDVETVIKDDSLFNKFKKQKREPYSELFKQYLVNKKVAQTFDIMDGKLDAANEQERFFIELEERLCNIFSDPLTKLEFARENFEFYINLSDGRRFTFNQLSAGYSAFLSIITELLMRVDLLRKQANDYTYDPCGFVLIDEPETHLHLEMQYQILPLLTSLFPNLQFIVATHSPAVASSIKNATVYDLSTGETLGDSAAGSSFSELMQTHFGLENEYSNVADAILDEVAEITALPDRAAARERLQKLLAEQGRYMSPVLRLDVQAQLLTLQNNQAA